MTVLYAKPTNKMLFRFTVLSDINNREVFVIKNT